MLRQLAQQNDVAPVVLDNVVLGRLGLGRVELAVHDDLVQRRFVADAPDRLWLTDITEHPTREGEVVRLTDRGRLLADSVGGEMMTAFSPASSLA